MRLRPIAPLAVLLLMFLGGCSSDGSDDGLETLDDEPEIVSENPSNIGEPVSPAVSDSELLGFWELSGYTLDDGTSRSVPDEIDVGVMFGSDGVLSVQHDQCRYYDISYRVDNDVLVTMDVVDDLGDRCTGLYGDADNTERSELLRLALLNTQTMVAVSDDDVLTVTSGTNEVLVFERVDELPKSEFVGQWQLSGYSPLGEDVSFEPAAFDGVRLTLDANGVMRLFYICGQLEGGYSFEDGTLSLAGIVDVSDEIECNSPATDDQTVQLLRAVFVDSRLMATVFGGDTLVVTTERNEELLFNRLPI